MKLIVTEELQKLCQRIFNEGRSDTEWSAIESDDMFQTNHFVGGYDATEKAFCFSFYDDTGNEFWFQVTLFELSQIADGKLLSIEARHAE